MRNALRKFAWLIYTFVSLNALPTLIAGDAGDRVQYVGGTITALGSKMNGVLNTREGEVFLFETKGVTVQVPYEKINVVEYGQRVGRRYAEAVLISPIFLLAKTRKHYLTVGFTDDQGKQQAMVFLVGKGEIRTMLVCLEAKTGRKVEYQDDNARRAGKGS